VAERLLGLRLLLHPNKARVFRTGGKVDVLGYQVSRGRRWLRNDSGRRFARRLAWMRAGYAAWRLDGAAVTARVRAWIGHACHGESLGLRRAILAKVVFRRYDAQAQPGGAGLGGGPRRCDRALRGGSWNNRPDRLRSANRNRNDVANRNHNIGFRLAQAARVPLRGVSRGRRQQAVAGRGAGVHAGGSPAWQGGQAEEPYQGGWGRCE